MNQPRYMLDTDTSSFFMKGRSPTVDARLLALRPWEYCISIVTYAELMYGLQRAAPSHPSHLRVRRFLVDMTMLDWDRVAADTYAALRYQLKTRGTPMADLDLMIAAHAMSLGATLVTNNTRHFGRLVPSLTIENWVADPPE